MYPNAKNGIAVNVPMALHIRHIHTTTANQTTPNSGESQKIGWRP